MKTATVLTGTALFVDDRRLADSGFVTRTWHEPDRFMQPVLRAEAPWERWCPVLFGTVLRRGDRWFMWYCGWTRQFQRCACLATSDDGIVWEKPDLGLYDVEGARGNNIVLQPRSKQGVIDDLTVIEDGQDSRWPLRMLFYESGGPGVGPGIYAARSADGVKWELVKEGPVLAWGDRFNAVPTRANGKFVVFGRTRDMFDLGKGRVVYRVESDDLREWSEPELVLTRDAEDPPAMEIYSLSAFPYAGMFLGGIERMHMSPDQLDPEITWSHDGGRTWQRSRQRKAFIPLAPESPWQNTWINLSASPPILNEQRLWFYYSARGGAHGAQYPLNQGAIGLATLRIDGFCSLRATERPGWVVTKPLTWPGGDLCVNVDPRLNDRAHPHFCHGEVRVEVRNPAGDPVPEFGLADCTPVRQNTANEPGALVPVRWGDRSAGQLAGRSIRLLFQLREAHLYSFRARPPIVEHKQ